MLCVAISRATSITLVNELGTVLDHGDQRFCVLCRLGMEEWKIPVLSLSRFQVQRQAT